MKTLKITEETHEKLSIIRAQAHLRTLSETIDWLINYRETVIIVHKKQYNFNDGEHDGNK